MYARYPARADAVPKARTAAVDCVRRLGAGDALSQAVALSVTEACSNVVVHAYRDRPEPGAMTVSVERRDHVLCVTVVDDGVGIAARPDSPGLGMGLPLISQVSDSLELRSPREGGAQVNMRFELGSRSLASL